MAQSSYAVVIIGTGPYGLAAAAHLRSAGIRPYVFGDVMEFWRRQMPEGMFLRSPWRASFIADPGQRLTLDHYQQELGRTLAQPLPLEDFIAYGNWFQQRAVPEVDARRVTRVEPAAGGYQLTLSDGETMQARRVVVAAGIAQFARRPQQFAGLPAELVTHSSEHDDLGKFLGQHVAVIGGGQSAFESAALLAECGADVELVMRAPQINWLSRSSLLHRRPWLREILYAPSDVGPAGLSQLVARPDMWRKLPRAWQGPLAQRSIRPAAASWLKPRMGTVRVTTGRQVASAWPVDHSVQMVLDDGSTRTVDHALLATGYRVDVNRYPFLGPVLQIRLRTVDGYPVLGPGFESVSLPGLHFMGAPAAWSFGPLMRFVAGTQFSAPALTRRIQGDGR